MPMHPTMRNPVRMRMRRTFPAARNPDIPMPIPTVIAINPDKLRTRRNRTMFDNRGRRSYLNIYLRIRRSRQQSNTQQQRWQ